MNATAFFGELFFFNSSFGAGKHFYDNSVYRELTMITRLTRSLIMGWFFAGEMDTRVFRPGATMLNLVSPMNSISNVRISSQRRFPTHRMCRYKKNGVIEAS